MVSIHFRKPAGCNARLSAVQTSALIGISFAGLSGGCLPSAWVPDLGDLCPPPASLGVAPPPTAVFGIGGFTTKLNEAPWDFFVGATSSALGASFHQAVAPIDTCELKSSLLEAHLRGERIILITFSLGNMTAYDQIVPYLKENKIPVAAWCMLDSGCFKGTLPKEWIRLNPKIPDNVEHIINFFSNGPCEGRTLTSADCENPETPIRNIYLDTNHAGLKECAAVPRILEELAKALVD